MGQERNTSKGVARLLKDIAKAKTIALDTMMFSYHYSGDTVFAPLARVVFEAIEQGEVSAIASSFALAEILAGITQTGDMTAKQSYFDLITSFPNLTFIPFDNEIAYLFAGLRSSIGLKPIDSVHVATAQVAHVDLLISNDSAWRNRFTKPKLILLNDYLN